MIGTFHCGGRTNIARLNADGTIDDGFRSSLNPTNRPLIEIVVDGKIVIGGDNFDGSGNRRLLCRLNGTAISIALESNGRLHRPAYKTMARSSFVLFASGTVFRTLHGPAEMLCHS
jgi:hypothetical protein